MVAGVENYSNYMTSEEIWVLSLPTFQWVLVHSRADGMYGKQLPEGLLKVKMSLPKH